MMPLTSLAVLLVFVTVKISVAQKDPGQVNFEGIDVLGGVALLIGLTRLAASRPDFRRE